MEIEIKGKLDQLEMTVKEKYLTLENTTALISNKTTELKKLESTHISLSIALTSATEISQLNKEIQMINEQIAKCSSDLPGIKSALVEIENDNEMKMKTIFPVFESSDHCLESLLQHRRSIEEYVGIGRERRLMAECEIESIEIEFNNLIVSQITDPSVAWMVHSTSLTCENNQVTEREINELLKQKK